MTTHETAFADLTFLGKLYSLSYLFAALVITVASASRGQWDGD